MTDQEKQDAFKKVLEIKLKTLQDDGENPYELMSKSFIDGMFCGIGQALSSFELIFEEKNDKNN